MKSLANQISFGFIYTYDIYILGWQKEYYIYICIYLHIYIYPFSVFSKFLQGIEYSFMFYTVGPCCLSLYM